MLGKKFWWAAAVVGLAVFPSVFVVHRAVADEDEEGDDADAETTPLEELSKKKKKVLEAIPTNESILINVTQREMPASPDLLNLGKRDHAEAAERAPMAAVEGDHRGAFRQGILEADELSVLVGQYERRQVLADLRCVRARLDLPQTFRKLVDGFGVPGLMGSGCIRNHA